MREPTPFSDGMSCMQKLIRQSLQDRLDTGSTTNDPDIMELVDKIVRKESILHMPGLF